MSPATLELNEKALPVLKGKYGNEITPHSSVTHEYLDMLSEAGPLFKEYIDGDISGGNYVSALDLVGARALTNKRSTLQAVLSESKGMYLYEEGGEVKATSRNIEGYKYTSLSLVTTRANPAVVVSPQQSDYAMGIVKELSRRAITGKLRHDDLVEYFNSLPTTSAMSQKDRPRLVADSDGMNPKSVTFHWLGHNWVFSMVNNPSPEDSNRTTITVTVDFYGNIKYFGWWVSDPKGGSTKAPKRFKGKSTRPTLPKTKRRFWSRNK